MGLTGHAVGADYNSDTGVVVLHSAVKVNGLERDRPVVLTASRAELDRQHEQTACADSRRRYVSQWATREIQGRPRRRRHVVVHLRPDGTVERIEAEGEVDSR